MKIFYRLMIMIIMFSWPIAVYFAGVHNKELGEAVFFSYLVSVGTLIFFNFFDMWDI